MPSSNSYLPTPDAFAQHLRRALRDVSDFTTDHYGTLFNIHHRSRARFVLTGSGKGSGTTAKLDGYWLVWDKDLGYWKSDPIEIHELAKALARQIVDIGEAVLTTKTEKEQVRRLLNNHGRILTAAAQSREGSIRPEDLNTNQFLLKVRNGTLDLTRLEDPVGPLRQDEPDDFITMCAGADYDPEAPAPLWMKYLERVQPDQDLRQVLQTMVGYGLTGDSSAHAFWILQGKSRAGKGVFKDVTEALLGSYAYEASFAEFLASKDRKRDTGPRPGLMEMFGKRLVFASEISRGDVLDDALIRQLAGSDVIRTRNLYEGETTGHRATFKLALISNHSPLVRSEEDAVWNRVRRVPWEVSIPAAERNTELTAELAEELPGILNWALEGLQYWQQHQSLPMPKVLREANAEYRTEMDPLSAWLDDCTAVNAAAQTLNADLYRSYLRWSEDMNLKPMDAREFGKRLRAHHTLEDRLEPYRAGGGARGYRGIAIARGGEGAPF